MTKEIELDEKDCKVFQDFVTKMGLPSGRTIRVTEFEVKGKNKLGVTKYEIEFDALE